MSCILTSGSKNTRILERKEKVYTKTCKNKEREHVNYCDYKKNAYKLDGNEFHIYSDEPKID